MKYLFFLLFLSIFLVGCSSKAIIEIPEVAEQDKAVAFATDAVLSSPQYHGGTALRTTDIIRERCLGCWKVELTFNKDGATVPVEVILKDWIIDDIFYPASAYSELKDMSEETARNFAENGICVQNSSLSNSGFYNENSRTWWFDIDLEKEGCAPACVVDEFGNSEINWRCTGLRT